MIFSKTTCFYCRMAKKLFEGLNVDYTAVELDVNKNGSQFQDILEQMTGGRTVSTVVFASNMAMKNLHCTFSLWVTAILRSSFLVGQVNLGYKL